MSKLKANLIALAVLAGLAVVGSFMKSRAADAGPAVTISGPLPLPVTGAATVSGTVSATQSGAWNVEIAGTPSVNIASLPAVQLSGTQPVNVTTQSGTPLLTVNLGDKGRAPYQATAGAPTQAGCGCLAAARERSERLMSIRPAVTDPSMAGAAEVAVSEREVLLATKLHVPG